MSFLDLFKKKKKGGAERASNIIVDKNSHSSTVECYNRLKDNILYLNLDNKVKVIQVESAISGEGKTTLICNLAVSLAQNEKKVAIIDLDFRKPRVHRTFDIENEDGISEFLMDKITKEQLIKKSKYNVDVINRGGKITNASLALTCSKFVNLMQTLRDEYDFVLVDAPPVLQISDYVNISRVTDGVIFVAAAGYTKRNQVREAFAEMRKNKVKVLGTVMTFVKKSNGYAKYYNYYGHKYYYYGSSYYDYVDKEDLEEPQTQQEEVSELQQDKE